MYARTFAVAAGLAALAGCPDRSISELEPEPAGVFTKEIATSADIDLLFVIDNSRSTADKQTVFAQNYPRFIAALDAFPGGRPNVHVGVVTTSVDVGAHQGGACDAGSGQDGVLQPVVGGTPGPGGAPVCGAPTAQRYLADLGLPGGGRQVSYPGTLDAALACTSMAVGDVGCGFEAPLEAMKRALDGSRPANAGFVRPGAFLAVVILTDEDDCSAAPALFGFPTASVGADDFRCTHEAYTCDQPISASAGGTYTGCRVRRDGALRDPSTYASFLAGLKGPSRVVVAVVGGLASTTIMTGRIDMPFHQDLGLQKACDATINGHYAIGRPALRLTDFARAFGSHSLFESVCQSDYSQVVSDIGKLVLDQVSPCLAPDVDPRDLDPATPGVQLACSVAEYVDDGGGGAPSRVIPPCAMRGADQPDRAGTDACWWVRPGTSCAQASQLELHVERAAAPAPGTRVRVHCPGAAP